jgi:uncharacterized repeat protein (TIGR03803 family)
MDSSGNIYNATEGGGAAEGTVYKLSPIGSETVLHSFGLTSTDGFFPVDGVIMDAAGNLYGTILYGGSAAFGTVYKVSPAGAEVILHTFGSFQGDGIGPYGPLVMDGAGVLYGTTTQGGTFDFGTVYKLNPAGTETVLHSFGASGQDGTGPIEGLIMDKQGNLYGTTIAGGFYGEGTVFEATAKGAYRTLYSFGGTTGDGASPATLTLDNEGNLYGTTAFGGAHGGGTVFKLSRGSWTETICIALAATKMMDRTRSGRLSLTRKAICTARLLWAESPVAARFTSLAPPAWKPSCTSLAALVMAATRMADC